MLPPKIEITGNDVIDTETAQLAVVLRDSGLSEREAIQEAQRIRDTFRAEYEHYTYRFPMGDE